MGDKKIKHVHDFVFVSHIEKGYEDKRYICIECFAAAKATTNKRFHVFKKPIISSLPPSKEG